MNRAEETRRPFLLNAALIAVAVIGTCAVVNPARFAWTDYTQDYLSARALQEGQSVYTPLPASSVLDENVKEIAVNDHPPPYILTLAPLAWLPYPTAFLVLAVVNAAAGMGALLIVARELNWSARITLLAALALMLHPGTMTCVCMGNVSLVLLWLVALGWRDFRHAQPARAGIWLGLATAFKLYPGLLLMGLVAGRAWKSLAIAVAVVVACWTAAALAVGFDDAKLYTRSRAPENAKTFVSHGFNLSVAGVAHRTFGTPNSYSPWLDRAEVKPQLAEALAWTGRTAIGLLVAFGVWRARGMAEYPDRAFAILVPGMLLLSPLTWLHALPMMLIPVAILARSETRVRLIALVASTIAMCIDDHWLAQEWVDLTESDHVPWPMNFVLLAPTWGMIGVLLLAVTKRRAG